MALRETMIAPNVLAMPARLDVTLVKALARAHRWRRMLEAGEHGNIRELAQAEKVNETYISRALRLALLAPDVVEALLDGRQPDGMTLPRLLAGVGRASHVDCWLLSPYDIWIGRHR